MQSPNANQSTEQTFPALTIEDLRPVVDIFLDRLTFDQWVSLEDGSYNMSTKASVRTLCVDIVETLAKHIFMALERKDSQQSPPKSSRCASGSSSSQKSITRRQIQDCLGDTISLTLAEAIGFNEEIHCRSLDEVTDLVVKEVTERMNSDWVREGKEPQASKKFMGRLKKMSQNLMTVLHKFMPFKPNLMTVQPESSLLRKLMAEEEEELAEDESDLTLMTPLTDDDEPEYSSKEGLFSTEEVKMILKEMAGEIQVFEAEAVFSDEEFAMLENNTKQDLNKAASDIVEAMERDFPLETTSRDCGSVGSKETALWQKVMRRIKTFFAHKFIKESILNFFAKLRNKFAKSLPKKDKASMKLLIDGVDWIVEDLIREDEKDNNVMCIYKRMARDITNGEYEPTEKHLTEFIFFQLSPDKKLNVSMMGFIRAKVDFFMKLLWNWLNEQIQLHERRSCPATTALMMIGGVVEKSQTTALRDEAEETEGHTWDRLTCEVMVTGLVDQILKKTLVHPSSDTYQSTITAMTELLWVRIKYSEMIFDFSTDNMKKTFKKLHKKLKKEIGEEMLWWRMVLQEEALIMYIVMNLEMQLLIPKQSSKVKQFFENACKIMAKPFVYTFRCC